MQFKFLKHDLFRYFYPTDDISRISFFRKIDTIVFTQGTWAIIVYRFRRWVITECKLSIIKKILKLFGAVVQLLIEITTGICIPPEIDIGPGFYIGHFGNIILGEGTKIGKFCNISQGCTVGCAGRGPNRGIPTIGDFVYIGPGAKVIGNIKIGNNVAIGANAVVTKDIPDDAVIVGVPAKVISYKSSRDFIEYNTSKNKDIL